MSPDSLGGGAEVCAGAGVGVGVACAAVNIASIPSSASSSSEEEESLAGTSCLAGALGKKRAAGVVAGDGAPPPVGVAARRGASFPFTFNPGGSLRFMGFIGLVPV